MPAPAASGLPFHRSLATRIIAGVALLLGILSIVSSMTLHRMDRMQEHFQAAVDVYLGLYGDVQEMRRLHIEQKMAFFEYLDGGRDLKHMKAYLDLGHELATTLHTAKGRFQAGGGLLTSSAHRDTLRALEQAYTRLRTGCTLCVHKGAASMENDALSYAELRDARDRFSEELGRFLEKLDAYQKRVYALAESGMSTGVSQHAEANALARGLWAMSFVAGGVLLVMVVAFLAPLRELSSVIETIGRGDYAQRLVVRSRDELGILASAVNRMAMAIREREESLETQASTIDRARRRFEGVFQGISDLLSIQDRDLVIGEANRALAQATDRTREEMIGERCHEMLLGRETPCEGCPALGTFESGRAGWMEQIDPRTGEIYEHHTYPIQDAAGQTVGVVEYTKRVTERRRLEKQLEESERMASLGQMATSIAHEIRNPLSSIKMSLQILGRRLRLECNDARRLEIAEREIGRLEDLLSEMLDFSRASHVELERISLLDLAKETTAVVNDIARERGVEVKVVEQGPTMAAVDPERMRRVLLNLFLNAFDAMADSPVRTLVVAVGGDGEAHASIHVTDSGSGMDERTRKHIFAPFFTTRAKGTGLGLAIAWKIVEAHRGRLEVASEPGKGTVMSIVLPVREEAA